MGASWDSPTASGGTLVPPDTIGAPWRRPYCYAGPTLERSYPCAAPLIVSPHMKRSPLRYRRPRSVAWPGAASLSMPVSYKG